MPFLAPLAIPLILGGSAVGAAALSRGGSSSSSGPSSASNTQLDPLIAVQKQIAEQTSKSGQADLASARGGLDFVNNFYKKILEGGDDDLLKMLDVSGATKNIDENEQLLSELGVRGGRRAASLGQASFSRDAAINNLLKQLRFSAPDKIAQINQVLANMGLGQLSTSVGAGSAASNTAFNVQQLGQQESDRRTNLIGSIMGTIGTVAGAVLGRR